MDNVKIPSNNVSVSQKLAKIMSNNIHMSQKPRGQLQTTSACQLLKPETQSDKIPSEDEDLAPRGLVLNLNSVDKNLSPDSDVLIAR